jgi:hypothetical protein
LRILRVVGGKHSTYCVRLRRIFSDALSVGYDNVEGLASLCWNRSAAVLSCYGVPWDLEILIISGIANSVYRHCKAVGSIDLVIEDLSPIEDRLGLAVGEVPP